MPSPEKSFYMPEELLSMSPKIAINGFGRIGRMTLRAAIANPNVELNVVAINDLAPAKQLAHLFKYDSVMREFHGEVDSTEDSIIINGKAIKILSEKDPTKLPWKELGVDVVLECTGLFTDAAKAKVHLDCGAKKVLISAPAKGEDITVAKGINDHLYDPAKHNIISNASCTTNCLGPITKVLHETFGIEEGLMVTIHSYTGDQRLLDAPHSDMRRARAAALSMVPTSTGAAKAIGLVMPELKGKFHGYAMRVPTPNVSVVDLTFKSLKPMTVESINDAIKKAAQSELKGILQYCDEPLVSCDFIMNPHSSIVDAALTTVLSPTFAKVVGWYDNEWGYSNRLAEVAQMVAQKLPVTA
jgi:glyceraldehyde 3-phosphate dehydrogenase